jgi:membrane dipeptidase
VSSGPAGGARGRDGGRGPGEEVERAAALHRRALLVDGHNDLTWRLSSRYESSFERFDLATRQTEGHTDLVRLREGGVGAQFFAVYVPAAYEGRGAAARARDQVALFHAMIARYPDLELARTAADARRIAESGRIAALLAVEGGHTIDGSLDVLSELAGLGARYMTLTHSSSTAWADSATDAPRHGGLSEFGLEVVRAMNRLGMLVDISHVSEAAAAAALRTSRAPVIASHSGARAICDHPRNLSDETLARLAENGGVAMVNFFSGFLVPEASDVVRDMGDLERRLRERHGDDDAAIEREWQSWLEEHPIPRGDVTHVVDHIDHISRVAGIDHVGLGSDFDGISQTPLGLEDVACFPTVTRELVRRGYDDSAILKILGENTLRVLARAEDVAHSVAASGR